MRAGRSTICKLHLLPASGIAIIGSWSLRASTVGIDHICEGNACIIAARHLLQNLYTQFLQVFTAFRSCNIPVREQVRLSIKIVVRGRMEVGDTYAKHKSVFDQLPQDIAQIVVALPHCIAYLCLPVCLFCKIAMISPIP
jgi:hypothetical protein